MTQFLLWHNNGGDEILGQIIEKVMCQVNDWAGARINRKKICPDLNTGTISVDSSEEATPPEVDRFEKCHCVNI